MVFLTVPLPIFLVVRVTIPWVTTSTRPSFENNSCPHLVKGFPSLAKPIANVVWEQKVGGLYFTRSCLHQMWCWKATFAASSRRCAPRCSLLFERRAKAVAAMSNAPEPEIKSSPGGGTKAVINDPGWSLPDLSIHRSSASDDWGSGGTTKTPAGANPVRRGGGAVLGDGRLWNPALTPRAPFELFEAAQSHRADWFRSNRNGGERLGGRNLAVSG